MKTMRAASNKTTIANINSNTHHTHHAHHTHHWQIYIYTCNRAHTHTYRNIHSCVWVCGETCRRQDNSAESRTAWDKSERDGKEPIGAGWDGTLHNSTVQYSTVQRDSTGRNIHTYILDRRQVMAAACWQNGERPKLTGTQRRNHEFHFKLWHAL